MSRTCRMSFELLATDGKARRGRLTFPRGVVETPAFMPVGTYGTVKGMLPRDIEATGAQMILGNTFHLWLRPGTEVIKGHGDLHDFMQWKGPILTDSGGFSVQPWRHAQDQGRGRDVCLAGRWCQGVHGAGRVDAGPA